MSFDDVRLPENIEVGAQGGPSFSTTIISLSSGREQRNSNWAYARHSFNISYGISRLADVQAVRSFFYARRGRANSFRFKDWTDYAVIGAALVPLGSGRYQLGKHYADAAGDEYFRPVTRVVAGTLTLSSGSFTEAWGILTGVSNPAALASFEFDIPMRFDSDNLSLTNDAFDTGTIPQINIIETQEDSLALNGFV